MMETRNKNFSHNNQQNMTYTAATLKFQICITKHFVKLKMVNGAGLGTELQFIDSDNG